MDKRQQKTRRAIYQAFRELLDSHRYESITVQQIIDRANIGRSTFYAHFDTKDDLLRSMCTDIFHHVFTQHPTQAYTHAHQGHPDTLEWKLEHILYHLSEHRQELRCLFKSASSELFLRYFKEYLEEMFTLYLQEFRTDIPRDFLLHHLVGSFSEAVKWWIAQEVPPVPETMAGYFMAALHL